MNVFLLGLKITAEAVENDGVVNVLAEALPSTERRVPSSVQLLQNATHYVGILLKELSIGETILAIGPTRATPDAVLQMQPMLVISKKNFEDLLAINLFVAAGGLGPKADEVELTGSTVTNRSLAWTSEDQETNWFKLTAWDGLSKQLSDLPPGTPTIAVGKIATSERDDRNFVNYTVDKILYLPKSSKAAPKKAADPEKGKVSAAALGSIDFSL